MGHPGPVARVPGGRLRRVKERAPTTADVVRPGQAPAPVPDTCWIIQPLPSGSLSWKNVL